MIPTYSSCGIAWNKQKNMPKTDCPKKCGHLYVIVLL